MKRFCPYVISTLLLCGVSSSAWSQEAGMSDIDISTSHDGQKSNAVYVPGEEMKYIPRATGVAAPSDSVMLQLQDFPMQRAAQRPAERTADKQSAKQKDDSILTFNFLYYIIQKYKLQDIID